MSATLTLTKKKEVRHLTPIQEARQQAVLDMLVLEPEKFISAHDLMEKLREREPFLGLSSETMKQGIRAALRSLSGAKLVISKQEVVRVNNSEGHRIRLYRPSVAVANSLPEWVGSSCSTSS